MSLYVYISIYIFGTLCVCVCVASSMQIVCSLCVLQCIIYLRLVWSQCITKRYMNKNIFKWFCFHFATYRCIVHYIYMLSTIVFFFLHKRVNYIKDLFMDGLETTVASKYWFRCPDFSFISFKSVWNYGYVCVKYTYHPKSLWMCCLFKDKLLLDTM